METRMMRTTQNMPTKPPKQRLPYGARSVEELERNQARLGPYWQERQRSWDERCGDYGPALPLRPLVWTAAMVAMAVGGLVLLSLLGGCADAYLAGANLVGVKVVDATDCRHPLHTTPCTRPEAKP